MSLWGHLQTLTKGQSHFVTHNHKLGFNAQPHSGLHFLCCIRLGIDNAQSRSRCYQCSLSPAGW